MSSRIQGWVWGGGTVLEEVKEEEEKKKIRRRMNFRGSWLLSVAISKQVTGF